MLRLGNASRLIENRSLHIAVLFVLMGALCFTCGCSSAQSHSDPSKNETAGQDVDRDSWIMFAETSLSGGSVTTNYLYDKDGTHSTELNAAQRENGVGFNIDEKWLDSNGNMLVHEAKSYTSDGTLNRFARSTYGEYEKGKEGSRLFEEGESEDTLQVRYNYDLKWNDDGTYCEIYNAGTSELVSVVEEERDGLGNVLSRKETVDAENWTLDEYGYDDRGSQNYRHHLNVIDGNVQSEWTEEYENVYDGDKLAIALDKGNGFDGAYHLYDSRGNLVETLRLVDGELSSNEIKAYDENNHLLFEYTLDGTNGVSVAKTYEWVNLDSGEISSGADEYSAAFQIAMPFYKDTLFDPMDMYRKLVDQNCTLDVACSIQEPSYFFGTKQESGEAKRNAQSSLDAKGYRVSIPDEFFGCEIRYDDSWYEQAGDFGLGYESAVSRGGQTLFSVGCFSSNWGPQGDFCAKELGETSNGDNIVSIWLYAPWGTPMELMEEYASWVEVN